MFVISSEVMKLNLEKKQKEMNIKPDKKINQIRKKMRLKHVLTLLQIGKS
jgi:hypothetical protein